MHRQGRTPAARDGAVQWKTKGKGGGDGGGEGEGGEGEGAVGPCYQGNNSESPYGKKIHWFMNHSLSVFLSERPSVSLSVRARMKTSLTSSLEFLFWEVDV